MNGRLLAPARVSSWHILAGRLHMGQLSLFLRRPGTDLPPMVIPSAMLVQVSGLLLRASWLSAAGVRATACT